METPFTQSLGTNKSKIPQKDGDISASSTTETSEEYYKLLSNVQNYFGALAKRSKGNPDFQRELTNMLLFGFLPARRISSTGLDDKIHAPVKKAGRKSKERGSTSTSKRQRLSAELKESLYIPPETVHQAKRLYKDRLILKMASPLMEKLARRYAEATLTKHHVTMKDLADEIGVTEKHVTGLVSRKEFPMILQKYLPVEDAMERHKELMEQDEDLSVAAKMVELAYKAHGVTGEKGEKPKSDFANFLQQINYNYAADNQGAASRPVVEVRESVQNQEQEGADSEIYTEQSPEGVHQDGDESGHYSQGSSDGVLDVEAHPTT